MPFIALENVVCFYATASGTADFIASTTAYASCHLPGNSLPGDNYYAQNADGSLWEYGSGDYNQTTRIQTRTPLSSSNSDDSLVNFLTPPIVAVWSSAPPQVNVKAAFNAAGDGVTNDFDALTAAGKFLAQIGGGKMYFPAGTYLMPGFGQQIEIQNNVEYYGDGYVSHIIGNNCALHSKGSNGVGFGRNTLGAAVADGGYTWYAANAVAAGTFMVSTTSAGDAGNFSVGQVVAICSTSNVVSSPTDTLPHFTEINRVAAVNAGTGVITLESSIDDAWPGSMRIADVSAAFSQNFAIHDLFVEASYPLSGSDGGQALYMTGSYNASIYNLWTKSSFGVIGGNGWVRCKAHDIIAHTVSTGSMFEIEVGSNNTEIYNIQAYVSDGSGDNGVVNPIFYTQEWSRRTSIRDVHIRAPNAHIGLMFSAQLTGGHYFENIRVNVKKVEKIASIGVDDNAVAYLPGLTIEGLHIEAMDASQGVYSGITLSGDAAGTPVNNFRAKDWFIRMNGAMGGPLIWFYQGTQSDHTFDNIHGPGTIDANMAGTGSDIPDSAGAMTNPLTNIEIQNCSYTGITNHVLMTMLNLRNNYRHGNLLPRPKYYTNGSSTSSTTVGNVIGSLVIPANAGCCAGDCVVVKGAMVMAATIGLSPGHVRLHVFGTDFPSIDFPAGSVYRVITFQFVVELEGTFAAPNQWSVYGTVTDGPDNIEFKHFFDTFTPSSSNTVKLEGWLDSAAQAMWTKGLSLTYIPIENRAAAGI